MSIIYEIPYKSWETRYLYGIMKLSKWKEFQTMKGTEQEYKDHIREL